MPWWREDPRPVLTMVRVALRRGARGDGRARLRGVDGGLSPRKGARGRRDGAPPPAPRDRRADRGAPHFARGAEGGAPAQSGGRAWVTRVLGMLRRGRPRRGPSASSGSCRISDADVRALADSSSARRDHPERAFFLRLDEVMQALRTSRTDLAPLVRARRAEYARDCARPRSPRDVPGAPAAPCSFRRRGVTRGAGCRRARGSSRGARAFSSPRARWASSSRARCSSCTRPTSGGRRSSSSRRAWSPARAAALTPRLVAREFGVPERRVNVERDHARGSARATSLRVDGDRGVVERLVTPAVQPVAAVDPGPRP